MLCLECGAEMSLVQVAKDTTMFVRGYEHQTWQCSACSTVERRMSFNREKTTWEKALERLRSAETNLKERTTAAREAERHSVPPGSSPKTDGPVRSPTEPIAAPAPTAHDEPFAPGAKPERAR